MTEIIRLAADLIREHGERAIAVASARAAEAEAADDEAGETRWLLVMAKVGELQSLARRSDDTVQ